MSTIIVGDFLGELLALTDDELSTARARAGELLPARDPVQSPPLLVTAAELARLTSTAASWWEAAARNLDCPRVKVGNQVRFKVADCLKWLDEAQEKDASGRVLRCAAAPRARSA